MKPWKKKPNKKGLKILSSGPDFARYLTNQFFLYDTEVKHNLGSKVQNEKKWAPASLKEYFWHFNANPKTLPPTRSPKPKKQP